MSSALSFRLLPLTRADEESEAATRGTNPSAAVAAESPWLRSAAYDLCFFAFAWVPFLLAVIFGLEWRDGFGIDLNGDNFRQIVLFLFALNFAHRNYTYLVAYGDAGVFRTRKLLFTLCPLAVFTTIFMAYSFPDPRYIELLVIVLTLWNVWHTIMQRYGLLRGYARRIKDGFEQRRQASLDLALLWGMVLFTMSLGTFLHLSEIQGYELTQSTVDAVAPIFDLYSMPLIVTSGLLLIALGGWWSRAELQHAIPFKQRLPRLLFLLSTVSLLALCLLNPVLGILAFGFSHSVEYLAYVHTVQKRKVETRQYQGAVAGFFWNNMLLGAGILIGLQVLAYYYSDAVLENDVILGTLVMGTGAIHFFYDGIIWKKSKPINTWAM
ncbi:MAG TPA: hypothetical protein VGL11_15095 [Candidatus Binatia bacterium]|jgi:hypothetical protein